MKRSVLVVMVLVLMTLLTTAGVSINPIVMRDSVQLPLNDIAIEANCPVILNGQMHVDTELNKLEIGGVSYEQHVNMQGVDGIQKGDRTFK